MMWEFLFGLLIFTIPITVYIYYSLSGRLHTEPMDKKLMGTSSGKLFRSKTHDAAFFDGANEDYTEAMSRLKTYGGG